MSPSFIAAGFLAAGVFFLGLAVTRLGHRRPLAALRSASAGVVTLALGALLVAIGLNLYTYSRFTYEQPVANLSFKQLGPREYRARIEQSGGEARVYTLSGDQWQLDARVLKWRGPITLLGLNAQYRLDRISGRYRSADAQNKGRPSAHDLGVRRGVDVWQWSHRFKRWMPWVDARYGSATYLPMADGARYQVSLTQSGLIARPANDAARRAVGRW